MGGIMHFFVGDRWASLPHTSRGVDLTTSSIRRTLQAYARPWHYARKRFGMPFAPASRWCTATLAPGRPYAPYAPRRSAPRARCRVPGRRARERRRGVERVGVGPGPGRRVLSDPFSTGRTCVSSPNPWLAPGSQGVWDSWVLRDSPGLGSGRGSGIPCPRSLGSPSRAP